MSVNKVISAIDPRNMHDAVMNKMDQVAVQKRSVAGKIFVKAPALVGLSVAGIVTNVAAAVTDAFILLGKLPLAAVKYGVMKPIRVITWSNAFESAMAKMPNGKSLLDTTAKVAQKTAGIFYSVTGLAFPKFNLRLQEQLGNFVNKRKAAEAQQVVETAKAAEAKKADEEKKAAETKAAAEQAAKAEEKARKEAEAKAETKKNGKTAADDAAFVAGAHLPIYRKAKEAQKALGRIAANDAAEVFRARERAKDIAYLEQLGVATLAMDGKMFDIDELKKANINLQAPMQGQLVRKTGIVVNGEAYTNKLFAKEDERRAVCLADNTFLENFAKGLGALEISDDEQFVPIKKEVKDNNRTRLNVRSLPDEAFAAQHEQHVQKVIEEQEDLERLGAYQLNDAEDDMNQTEQMAAAWADLERLNPIVEKPVAVPAPVAAEQVAAPTVAPQVLPVKIAAGNAYRGGNWNPLNWLGGAKTTAVS